MLVDRHRLHSVKWFLSGVFAGAILTALISFYNPQYLMATNWYSGTDSDIKTKLIHQRNMVSEILNRQQQQIGVLQCEVRLFVFCFLHACNCFYFLAYYNQ